MQRAIACALLAEGVSILRNPSFCDDAEAALALSRGLGAEVEVSGSTVKISGSPRFRFKAAGEGGAVASTGSEILSCGESGLCIRMFSPIAALLPGERLLEARGSLAKRPMAMVTGPLESLGAEVEIENGLPPIRIRGPMRGGDIGVDGGQSSQLLTGLLIALPLAPGNSSIRVSNAVSRGYLDLTLDTMRAFGVEAKRDADFSMFEVPGGLRYRACDFTVEGDWSGAAFLLVAGAIASADSSASQSDAMTGSLRVEGIQIGSSQPDKAILTVLESAGARIELGDADTVAVSGGDLRAFEFDATDCPDLFPPLVALASACSGRSRIAGAGRLKAKESDRALVLIEEFGALGIKVSREGDALEVQGGTCRAGTVRAHGDHRIAMAAAVAALRAEGSVTIEGSECVAKSWPGFFGDLDSIRLSPRC